MADDEVKALCRQILCEMVEINSAIRDLANQLDTPATKSKKQHSPLRMPRCGLRHKEVRDLVIDLRKKLFTVYQITAAIKQRWPNEPGKHVSKSTVHRFIEKAKRGDLESLGVDAELLV